MQRFVIRAVNAGKTRKQFMYTWQWAKPEIQALAAREWDLATKGWTVTPKSWRGNLDCVID
jgi:hypothetical protein